MITPDSVHYINWTAGMCPVYPALLAALKPFGAFQLYAAVAIQIILALFAAWKFNETMCIGGRRLKLLSLAAACSLILLYDILTSEQLNWK